MDTASRSPLSPAALDQLFLEARTHNVWRDVPVDDATLQQIYALSRMGPTAANSCPARFVFVKSPEAKARLRPALSPGNVDKTMAAPATAIVAYDAHFYEQMVKLFPARPEMGASLAATAEPARDAMASQNTWLQAGYFILAARALGLDCGPMGGFDKAKVDAAFFEGQAWRSALLINLGHGDATKLFPRNPRLSFEDACRIA
jgi:3-hydroxypropanoate dehydrogenase